MQRPLFVKRWFLQGIVVLLPVIVTAAILYYGIQYADSLLWFVWDLLPFKIEKPPLVPGLGLIIVFCTITLIGALAESWLINHCIRLFNKLMAQLPVVRNIYNTVLKVSQNAFGSQSKFSGVVLVPFPSKEQLSIAFKTGPTPASIKTKTGKNLMNVFIPTTPNPTSGFYLMIPEESVIDTDITPEQAFKLILSAGIMHDD